MYSRYFSFLALFTICNIAFGANIYAFTPNINTLYTIDLTNGAVLDSTGLPSVFYITDVEFSPDGVLHAFTPDINTLYTLDLTNGAVLDSTALPSVLNITDVEVSPDGVLDR